MIGVVDVEVQAANPQMPLYTFRAFVNSPSSVRVRNVPTEIGAWKITSVRVVVAYPDSSIKTADCVLAGSVWVATVAGCAVSGTAENGFTVFASGVDENGNAVSNYCLGKGNVEILKADGTLSPDAPSYYVHLFDEQPTAPNEGDMWPTSGGFAIWHDGEAHGSITVDSALSATSENPVQNKVVTAALNARPTKAQMDEGWWSEWVFSGTSAGEGYHWETYFAEGDESGIEPHWSLDKVSDNDVADRIDIGYVHGTQDDTEIEWDNGVSATRHRVAAPVPTRPEDIGAQPQGDYYQKPSGGIPATDLASAVQTSLGKADTAVQPSGIAGLMPMYPFVTPTVASGTLTISPFTNAQIEMGKWTVLRDGVDVTSQVLQPVWVEDAHGPGSGAWGVDVVTGESSEGYADYDEDALSIEWIGTDDGSGSSSHYTATRPPSAFEIAVGALPTGVTGKARDCILVIDCTATGAVAPTVTWGTHFHPRTDAAKDLAIVEAGKRAVFYISEYATGEFAVGGWVETDGGYASNGGSGT